MQEPETKMNIQEPDNAREPAVKRKPTFIIGVSVASALVLLAALIITYSIVSSSYNKNLDRLKGMVADTASQFEKGDVTDGATPSDQYRFYLTIDAQIKNLSDILAKLNKTYALLPGKASEKDAGIAKLKDSMGALSPGLTSFKECIDEDASITGELSRLLGGGIQGGQSTEYQALSLRNGALTAKITAQVFSGALESSRMALSGGIAKRGTALDFLVEEASAGEELAVLLADIQASPADLIARLNALIEKNDELTAKAAEANVEAYGSGGIDVAQLLAGRKDLLNAYAAYLAELQAVQQNVLAFNGNLELNTSKEGKFTERLASWSTGLKDLNALDKQLKTVNGKPEYLVLETKRTLPSLGLSTEGQGLLDYLVALNAVDAGVAGSKAIEKEIDSLMKNTKLSMVKKITALEKVLNKNAQIIASIAVDVPADLAEGLANFNAGCTERAVFLNEYMGYIEDNVIADGHAVNRSAYLKEYNEYKAQAATYAAGSDECTFYTNLASDKQKFANEESSKRSASLKAADAHKKAYEASRKKYVPLLDK